jgi:hypothetical protein
MATIIGRPTSLIESELEKFRRLIPADEEGKKETS